MLGVSEGEHGREKERGMGRGVAAVVVVVDGGVVSS